MAILILLRNRLMSLEQLDTEVGEFQTSVSPGMWVKTRDLHG